MSLNLIRDRDRKQHHTYILYPMYAESSCMRESFKGAMVEMEREDLEDGGEILTLRKKTVQPTTG